MKAIFIYQIFSKNKMRVSNFYRDLLQLEFVKNRVVSFTKTDSKKIFVSISAVLGLDQENKVKFIEGTIEDYTEQINRQNEKDLIIGNLQDSVSLLNRPIDPFIKPVPRCNLNLSAEEAIRLMAGEKSEAVLLTMDSEKEIGIVTLTDLKNRLLVNDTDLKSSVHKFMSSPLISIDYSSSIYDALVCLFENDVHHLLVKNDNSKIIGIINSGELQKTFHLTYLFFIQKIQDAESISEIKSAHTASNANCIWINKGK